MQMGDIYPWFRGYHTSVIRPRLVCFWLGDKCHLNFPHNTICSSPAGPMSISLVYDLMECFGGCHVTPYASMSRHDDVFALSRSMHLFGCSLGRLCSMNLGKICLSPGFGIIPRYIMDVTIHIVQSFSMHVYPCPRIKLRLNNILPGTWAIWFNDPFP